MDINEIQERLAHIQSFSECDADDDAHSAEDRLYLDFVQFVAQSGQEPLSSMATEVLKTKDMDFDRWYA